jgi:hypothetical protein
MDRPEDELLLQAFERQLLEGADAPHEAVVRRKTLHVEIGRGALVHVRMPRSALAAVLAFLGFGLARSY